MVKKYMLPGIVVITWLIATLARLGWHGDVYGFNFAIFQPDGMLYSFKSLMFLGADSQDSALMVTNWYSKYSGSGDTYASDEFLSNWSAYPSERILYPLFSAPFVALLGLNGMLVIPIFSFLVLLLNVYYLGIRLDQPYLGIGLSMLLSFSPTVTRWMISSTPDSLLVAIISFFPIIFISAKIKYRKFLFVLIVIASSLARFSLSIFILMAIIFWLQKEYKLSAAVFLSSLILSIPALLHLDSGFLPRNNGGLFEKIIDLPKTFIQVGFIELAQLAVLDRLLLTLIFAALVLAVKFHKSTSSYFFFSTFVSVWILGTLNGSLGVNFRYQLPILIFCCWVIFDTSPRVFSTSNVHIKVKEV